METGELISVVIPVYNVEEYLECCIRSVVKQSYTNIEIILVDDGSTDNSGKICDKYAVMDKRIDVFHKKNGGLSDARNKGMELSKGEYITFIDSDDYIGKNYIETLYNSIKKNNADISMCDYLEVDSLSDSEIQKQGNQENLLSNIECLCSMYHPRVHGMEFVAWAKLYKKKIFSEGCISYPVGKVHEDIFTTYLLVYSSKSVVFTDYVGYFYRKRSGSIMNNKFNVRNLDAFDATREACNFFMKKGEKVLLTYAANYHIKNSLKMYIKLCSESTNAEMNNIRQAYLRDIRKDIFFYIKEADFSIVKSIAYAVVGFFPTKLFMKFLIR